MSFAGAKIQNIIMITEGDFYYCHGTMYGHGSYLDTWQVAVFNRCDQKNVTSLDVSYELTFHEGDEPEWVTFVQSSLFLLL